MKKLLALAALVISVNAFAVCEDKFAYQEPVPQGDFTFLCHVGYATIHNNQAHIPLASFEHLTPDHIGHGNVERKNSFREDADLRPDARARLKDYKAGADRFDRGHMADAQNAGSDKEMFDTFLLSNMVPQVSSFNRGMWKNLETHVAKMVRGGRELYVISGSVIGRNPETIGPDHVVIPASLFKVVVDKKNNDAIAYLIPNAVSNRSYTSFQISINDLTKVLGVDILPGAPDSLRNATGQSLK